MACSYSGNDSWRADCSTVFDSDSLWLGIETFKGVKLDFVYILKFFVCGGLTLTNTEDPTENFIFFSNISDPILIFILGTSNSYMYRKPVNTRSR